MSTVDPQSPRSLSPSAQPAVAPSLPLSHDTMRTEPFQAPLTHRLTAQLAYALRRRWLFAVLFGLFGSWLAAATILSQMPTQHRAEVWLQIQRAPRAADREIGSSQAQELFLKSQLVLNAALEQPELQALLQQRPQTQPLEWLEQSLRVETVPGQSLVCIGATSQHADEPALLVHAVTQAFLHEIEDRQRIYLTQRQEEYQQTQERLRSLRAALTAAEDPRLAQIESERQQIQRERTLLLAELSALQAKEKTLPAPAPAEIETALKANPGIRECQKEVERLNEQIEAYERISVLGKDDPALPRLRAQRDEWNRKLAERRQVVTALVEQQAAAKGSEPFRARREVLETKRASLDELETKLAADGKALAGNDGAPAKTQALRDDLAAQQETVRRLAVELQTLEAEAKPGACVAQLGDIRSLPDVNHRQRLWAASGGAGVSFVLLALLAGWVEWSDKRVKSAGDVCLALNLPILGTLPDLKKPPVASEAATGPEAEAVDVLRTLLVRRTGGGPCVVLVTSAGLGEGKTTLAAHLAASLARAWRKTLLVDGDLRHPGAHKAFNAVLDPGLSDVLRGDVEAADAIQPTPLSWLWLLPAGHSDSHALQALAQHEGAAFLDGLREHYEFIIVDSAPVLPIADTLLLCQRADAVVLAVRCGTSRLPSVRAAQQRLGAMSAPFLGAIVLGS
jgi:polysaccharide biosynthesis transport protein